MGIELILVAAVFIAASNLCMRRSIDGGGTTKAYLVVQLFLVFLVAILIGPVRSGDYHWSPSMASFGFTGGLILVFLLAALGRALETGPPGLTFAALNASTVMPTVLMVAFFGGSFGYFYTWSHGIGSLLVILGLFWATRSAKQNQKESNWVTYITIAFCLHVLFLVFLNWRALFINFPKNPDLFLDFDYQDATSPWFMPMVFLAAFLVQLTIYLIKEKRALKSQEVFYGIVGGITNGVGTFFMIRATEVSTSLEHAVLYPIFAVTVIILCNLWGQWLYKEKISWKANALCVGGLIVGTLNWAALNM